MLIHFDAKLPTSEGRQSNERKSSIFNSIQRSNLSSSRPVPFFLILLVNFDRDTPWIWNSYHFHSNILQSVYIITILWDAINHNYNQILHLSNLRKTRKNRVLQKKRLNENNKNKKFDSSRSESSNEENHLLK